jgi:hypothetical protein
VERPYEEGYMKRLWKEWTEIQENLWDDKGYWKRHCHKMTHPGGNIRG